MTKTITLKNRISLALAAVLFTAFSYLYLDAHIALLVHQQLRRSALLEKAVSEIPDLLRYIVVAITLLSWTGYFFLKRRGTLGREMKVLRALGTVVPAAFLAKVVLQFVFGRSGPHIWVFYHLPPRFYWFRSDAGYGCFPSGHMTVFTALMTTVLHYYPRYRRIILVLLFLLALALIATNYHFLSDVVAGALLGAAVAFVINEKMFPEMRT